MHKFLTTILFTTFLTTLIACSGDDARPNNEEGPAPADKTYAIFNPSLSDLPIPNDFLFAGEAAGDGTMFAGEDPGNPVIEGIDALDGNSVIAPFDIRFSGSLDASQELSATSFVPVGQSILPNPSQNVFLLPLSYPGGDALVQASLDLNEDGVPESVEVPTFAKAATYLQAVASGDTGALVGLADTDARAELLSLDGGLNNTLRITPIKPLMPETKYLVVVTGLRDAAGNDVLPAIAYDFIGDPSSNIIPALEGVRGALLGWQTLAAGYFSFMQAVYDGAGIAATAPSADNIIFSMTFTTGGTDSILKSITAPELFFEKSLRQGYKHDAIRKLVNGTYNLNGDNSNASSVTDGAINSTLNVLLTSATLPPDDRTNPLYNPTLAGAVAAGATFQSLSSDASTAYRLQVAAAEAAIAVHDSGALAQGDINEFNIASEAVGTVSAVAGAAGAPVASVFPIPAPRPSNFYRVDLASDIQPALLAPALIYQGEISLPYFMDRPTDTDGSIIRSTRWEANRTIGAIIDGARGNDQGTTPPSSMVTYRYPFPTQKGSQTLPITVTMPEPTTLAQFGIAKPEAGWPVVIYVHGIGSDRTSALPMADAMAFACVDSTTLMPTGARCYATVAIDLPLHGISPTGGSVPGLTSVSAPGFVPDSNVSTNTPSSELMERHLNFTADVNQNPTPMSYESGQESGVSGSLFTNLADFTNGRSLLGQMVLDLFNLNASIASMDVNGDGIENDLDPDNVYLSGMSLGGIIGLPFVATNNSPSVLASPFSDLSMIKAASLFNTGGALPTLLINSRTFSPGILGGLAAASPELQVNRSGLESYLSVYQGIYNAVDPITFAASLTDRESATGILLTEILGDGTAAAPADQVIPNAADDLYGTPPINGFPAPFAGTEPLARLLEAVRTADAVSDGDPAVVITRFTEGSHGNYISAGNSDADPYSSRAVFLEMLSQIIAFFEADGDVSGSIISNPDVVED